ncbi:NEDD4-binding protein 2-like 1 isoform X3 [Tachyglossus aculeatus]|uniref:NEDD4-binding protein 2-like 1 isoform X3 n=1 Tax=Tachyglossus aculeatus TaxID=9261 RepID=UPI0018F76EC9|nr:NEDD4-binding protein 2-like 1 isoform X3 [Tachyglossus aculeatus]
MDRAFLRSFGGLGLGTPGTPPPARSRPRPRPRPRFSKRLYLLRGLPGAGKTSLARQLKRDFPQALIFSTDDFFVREDGTYEFNPDFLGEAHKWNQERARTAMRNGESPVIIDNTNLQSWEMRPYAVMALENNYEVIFREPDTRWKFNVQELARRNIHGVSKEKIRRMKEWYEHGVTFQGVLHSEKPSGAGRPWDQRDPTYPGPARPWSSCPAGFPGQRAPLPPRGGFHRRYQSSS